MVSGMWYEMTEIVPVKYDMNFVMATVSVKQTVNDLI